MIFYERPHAVVSWNEEIRAAVITWKGFAKGDEFRATMNKVLELAALKSSQKFLGDMRQQGPISIEDQDWSNNHWIPQAYNQGIRFTAIVLPQNIISQMALDRVTKRMETNHKETVVYFDNLEAAKNWLRTRP